MTKKEYKNELEKCMFVKKKQLKKNAIGSLESLVRYAFEHDELSTLSKAFKSLGLGIIDKTTFNDIVKKIVDPEPEVEQEPEAILPSLTDILRELKITCTLDKMGEKTRYLVKHLDRTGIYKANTCLTKVGRENVKEYIEGLWGQAIPKAQLDWFAIPPAIPVFDPAGDHLIEKHGDLFFNTWSNPELASLDKLAVEPEKPETYHLFEKVLMNLVGEDPLALEYVLNVLAYCYQHKTVLPSVLVFATTHGAGKGLLEIVLQAIFTESHIGKGNAKHNIFNASDNAALKNKLLYILDEAPIGGEYYEDAKSYIGNSKFPLKELFQNGASYPNHALFLNFFNLSRVDEVKFKIAEDDRRISLFTTQTKIIDMPEFAKYTDFAKLGDIFDIGNGIPEYFAWELATLDIDYDLISRPYETEIRQAWIDAGKDFTKDFYKAIVNRDFTFFEKYADGKMVDGYSIIDTVQKIFDGKLEPRIITISNMYKGMFGEDEIKDIRDSVMSGLKTRLDSGHGSWVYKLPVQVQPQNTTLVPPRPPQGIAC